MATTKTSTKAKTKTSKAKSATKKTAPKKATPKKVTAAKATASKSTTKSAAVKKPNSVKKAANVTVAKLRSLQWITAGIFALLAVVAAFVMGDNSSQLTLGHVAKDELSGSLVPAVQAVYDVQIRWIVVATMVVSAILPILYLTKLQKRYTDYVENTRMQPMRWIDYAVTGALITETIVLLSGVSDIATLKLVGGLVVLTAVLGLVADRQNNKSAKPVRSAFCGQTFAVVLTWLFVAIYAVSSVIYGNGNEWYVYALYAATLSCGVLWLINQKDSYTKGVDALKVERNYIAGSVLAKAAFAIILIVAFRG